VDKFLLDTSRLPTFSHSIGCTIPVLYTSAASRRSSIFPGRSLSHLRQQFFHTFIAYPLHRPPSLSKQRLYSSDQSSNDGDDERYKMEQYYKQYMDLFKRDTPTNGNTSAIRPNNDDQESPEFTNAPSDQSSFISTVLSMSSNRTGDRMEDPPSADSSFVKMLSHVDNQTGKAKMVNVGGKSDTRRVAVATGRVRLSEETFRLVQDNQIKKGDVLTVAQLAGIMATKQTSCLIPLCHNITIAATDVQLTLDISTSSVVVCCTVSAVGRTGVEMEALTGVSVAALTVYDMCKSVSQDIVIEDIKLVSKVGGKSGKYVRKS
jgi:cyclic pyranopterin monophosphate synthase